jgi:hypothetical protein
MDEGFGFKDREIPIDVLYNEEQLLDFALHYMAMQDNQNAIHPVAEQIIVTYILREWQKKDKVEFTEDEVHERMAQLIADHILTSLVSKGLVEVSFNENGEALYKNVDLEGLI